MTTYQTALYAGDYPLGIFIDLEHALARAIFRQLAAALRAADHSYPDVSTDRQIAIITNEAAEQLDWRLLELIQRFPRIVVLERGDRKPMPEPDQQPHDPLVTPSIPAIARFVTSKATFFNYLSPQAIRGGLGVDVEVTDTNDVPLATAQALQAKKDPSRPWNSLDRGQQERLVDEAKDLLCTEAAPRMTEWMLVERKAKSEVARWLYAIKLRLPHQIFD